MTLDELAEIRECVRIGAYGGRSTQYVVALLAEVDAQREQLEQAQKAAQVAALNLASVMARSEQQKERAEKAEQQLAQVTVVLKELRINANRLCDRNLGGTYEEDCRRSIARADAVLTCAPTSR